MVLSFKAETSCTQQNLAVETFFGKTSKPLLLKAREIVVATYSTQASCTDQNSAEFFTTFSAVEPHEETVPL